MMTLRGLSKSLCFPESLCPFPSLGMGRGALVDIQRTGSVDLGSSFGPFSGSLFSRLRDGAMTLYSGESWETPETRRPGCWPRDRSCVPTFPVYLTLDRTGLELDPYLHRTVSPRGSRLISTTAPRVRRAARSPGTCRPRFPGAVRGGGGGACPVFSVQDLAPMQMLVR